VASRAGGEPGRAGGGLAVQRRAPVREFRSERGGLIQPLGVEHRRAVAAQAYLRERSQLSGKLLRGGQRLPGRYDAVGEPDRGRLGRVDRAPGEDHFHRPAGADQPGQAHGAAVDQRDAPATAEHAEHGGLVGDPQVAPQRQFQAARHRVPRYRGDDRLGQPEPADPHRGVAVRGHPVAALGADRGQVRAGTENAALAVQHGHRRVRVGVERAERGGQLRRGRAVDSVAPRGTVQQHGGDRPRPHHPDRFFSHVRPPDPHPRRTLPPRSQGRP